jgi:hypothetical protein
VEARPREFPFVSERTSDRNIEELYEVTDRKWARAEHPIGKALFSPRPSPGTDLSGFDVRIEIDSPPIGYATLEWTAGEFDGQQVRRATFVVRDLKGIAGVEPNSTVYLNVRNPKRWGADDVP